MTPRLLWKIVFTFWGAIALANIAVVLFFTFQTHFGRDVDAMFARQRAERVEAAAVALHYGGRPALDQVTRAWPGDERARLSLTSRPDGRVELALARPKPFQGFPLIVWLPIGVLFTASFLVSAALAAYLARPIGRLRDGFSRLAQGELGVRLTPGMGRRRDEIADLAQDFDAMAERLQQLIASRDRLLHDVSHELRSPLARMAVAVDLAHKAGDIDSAALARIESEGARLNTIVGDLLSLSRAESEAGAEEIYFDLASLLEVVCDDARFEAQPRGVSVALALGPELAEPAHAPLLTGAPELLRRAVENVIRNALRFSPPGGAVEVGARQEGERIVIDVADQGPGAPPELLETMFEPFVKGQGEARGVGLGLSIARRALAAHGGSLEARNRPGGGLVMRITLPLAGARSGETAAGAR
jgi:two-component system OmpR family sensor kinase